MQNDCRKKEKKQQLFIAICDPTSFQITTFILYSFQKGNVTVVVTLEVQNVCAQEAPPPTHVQQKLNDLECCCCVLQLCRQIRHNHITYTFTVVHTAT